MKNQPKQPPGDTPSDKPQKQRVRLPFEPRKQDAGTWSYNHRVGISITVILYLLVGIGFLWGRIDLGSKKGDGTILIEFPEEEKQVELTEEQIRALEAAQFDFSDVRNLTSNENAEFDASLKDAKGMDAGQLYEDAGALDDKLRASREAYEEGLRQIEAMRQEKNDKGRDTEVRDAQVKGMVTVSYSFVDPMRNKIHLVIPAYRCEGGGQVVVNATLDNSGKVVSATVDKARSASDNCMQTTAVSAALQSRFNADSSAPSKHRGTITYIFIPQ